MQIIISQHARKRLHDIRQSGIDSEDIVKVASEIPGRIPVATRFRGFVSSHGRVYDLVAKDVAKGRLIITIIGR
jgi:transketolase C-terminal domain/subunit